MIPFEAAVAILAVILGVTIAAVAFAGMVQRRYAQHEPRGELSDAVSASFHAEGDSQ